MAGTYADVPAPRIAYDLIDIEPVFWTIASTISSYAYYPTSFSTENQRRLNSEGNGASSTQDQDSFISFSRTNYIAFIFPELYDIRAYKIVANSGFVSWFGSSIEVSTDTTSGIDGTWTQVSSTIAVSASSTRDVYRPPTALSVDSIIAIRFSDIDDPPDDFHLYGNPTVNPAPVRSERIAFYRADAGTELTGPELDMGDISRGSTYTKTFRVRNYAPVRAAVNTTISMNQLYPPTGSISAASQYLFSFDNINFSATLTIPVLYSGQYSDVIYMRKVTPSNATVGLWSARVETSVEYWV